MSLDLESQEAIDNAKHLWHRIGPWLTWTFIGLMVVFLGYRGYNYYQGQQGEKAAIAYDAFDAVASPGSAGDKQTKLIASIERLQKENGNSIYAHIASLRGAKILHDAQNNAAALQALNWLIQQDDRFGYRSMARLRAASLLIDKKDYAAATAMLNSDIDPAFKTLTQDLQADLYLAQNKTADAIAVLKAALAATASDDPLRPVLSEKLAALGVDPGTIAASDAKTQVETAAGATDTSATHAYQRTT